MRPRRLSRTRTAASGSPSRRRCRTILRRFSGNWMNPMPRRFDLLVFDWDGTLMDSAGAISHSLRLACADLKLTVPSDEAARYVIGLGLNDALRHLLPELPKSGCPALL